jgi:hypothetical protein
MRPLFNLMPSFPKGKLPFGLNSGKPWSKKEDTDVSGKKHNSAMVVEVELAQGSPSVGTLGSGRFQG